VVPGNSIGRPFASGHGAARPSSCIQHWAVGGRQRRSRLCVTARQPLPKTLRRTIQAVFACRHPSNHHVVEDEARFADVMLQICPRSARQTNRSQTGQTRKAHHHHHQVRMAMHMFATEPAQKRDSTRLMPGPGTIEHRRRSSRVKPRIRRRASDCEALRYYHDRWWDQAAHGVQGQGCVGAEPVQDERSRAHHSPQRSLSLGWMLGGFPPRGPKFENGWPAAL